MEPPAIGSSDTMQACNGVPSYFPKQQLTTQFDLNNVLPSAMWMYPMGCAYPFFPPSWGYDLFLPVG